MPNEDDPPALRAAARPTWTRRAVAKIVAAALSRSRWQRRGGGHASRRVQFRRR
jgi:hypothetical protein